MRKEEWESIERNKPYLRLRAFFLALSLFAPRREISWFFVWNGSRETIELVRLVGVNDAVGERN